MITEVQRHREPHADGVCQKRSRTHQFARATHLVSGDAAASVRIRGAGVQRVSLAADRGYACARSRRAQARKARREWIVRTGASSADTPMWTSRVGWLTELTGWLATDEGRAESRRLHIRPERSLAAAAALAAHADHASGRHCAVSNATVAAAAGCSERTVTTVRKLLSISGLAIEIHRGTGSSTGARYGRRPSIWHLVSRRKPITERAVCDLPPSRRDRRLTPVRSQSPNARASATRPKSHSPSEEPKRRRRCAPRPLHVQQLAARLVAGSQGLDRGHIGSICDALTRSGLDLDAWTAKQLLTALNADMKERRWDWPNRIDSPGSFLASRLRNLPARPDRAPHGAVTARPQKARTALMSADTAPTSRQSAQADTDRWHAEVEAVTTPEQRAMLLHAHEVRMGPLKDPVSALAGAGRRASRLYPDLELGVALARWAESVLGDQVSRSAMPELITPARSFSADALVDLMISDCECLVCGGTQATARPQLPLKSMVCDQCWPVIAAELNQASDIEETLA